MESEQKPLETAQAQAVQPSTAALRIGIMVDSFEQPAWIAHQLRRILDRRIATVELVILNATESAAMPAVPRNRVATWIANRKLLPYALFKRADERRYRTAKDPFRRVDITPLTQGAVVLPVQPQQGKFSDIVSPEDIARIRRHDLDVILRFGFRILRGSILQAARFGVWSFHHGDSDHYRGGPAGFWEVVEGRSTTGAVLQCLTEELDGGPVLGRARARTDPVSPTRNSENIFWDAAVLMERELRILRDTRRLPQKTEAAWRAYSSPLYRAPTGRHVARHAVSSLLRLTRAKIRACVRRPRWSLAIHVSPGPAEDDGVPHPVLHRFRELTPPPRTIWADPFPVAHAGQRYLFFEEQHEAQPHAHISVMEVDGQGRPHDNRPVLEAAHHLSYPNVFRWKDAWWLIPETLSTRSVQLFRAEEFPDRWTRHAALIEDIDAVDPTICEIEGRWWLFIGVVPFGSNSANALEIFYADQPLGPWTPHRRNPVKIDVVGARPAGRLFCQNGVWFRPGQDGSRGYGSGIAVHQIEVLTPDDFCERIVSRIRPRWSPGLIGTHTINAAGGLTAIDTLRLAPR